MKAYYDNVVASGKTRSDLPPSEMAALQQLEGPKYASMLEVFTSRESWREQERTNDPAVRQALRQARPDVPVVPYDHEVFGFSYMPHRYGGFISNPAITDVTDQPLFDDLRALGLKDADARHLMYAVRNGCERFVTLDRRGFLNRRRRQRLEARCGGLRIVTPSELLAELVSAMDSVDP